MRQSFIQLCLVSALSTSHLLQAAPFDTAPAAVTAAQSAYEIGKQAALDKNWSLALKELKKAEAAEPNNADVHNMLGYTYRWQGQLELAFQHYRRSLELNPNHRGTHEYMGKAFLMNKQPEEAQKLLANLEKICGKSCPEYKSLEIAITNYKPQ
ncbi:tetratricopeptide repeat protein [Parvibium lacunae]|nr:tetratricopeptide repeat protein [Parvibium lacunae]